MSSTIDKLPATVVVDVTPDEEGSPHLLRQAVARHLRQDAASLPPLHIVRRVVDARRGRVRFHLTIALHAPTERGQPGARETPGALGTPGDDHADRQPDRQADRQAHEASGLTLMDSSAPPVFLHPSMPREVSGAAHVVVVGDGPAGLFCAFELACLGIRCTVVDRGKPVQPRRRDLAKLHREGLVHPESNYCFGEGGAGTYSDGKLYTRATKRGDVRRVLEILVRHGAPPHILIEARPHIGSNKLPKVISAMRAGLEQVGVAFRFGARVDGLVTKGGGAEREVSGVRLAHGEEIAADAVVLATGHSARDVFVWLQTLGVHLEAKDFALGVRIEHPQPLINRIQYGEHAGHPRLGSASYRLAHGRGARSVFSFCMCPGGWVVPASTEAGELVVNGMSLSKRNSPYANSGLVVAISQDAVRRTGAEGACGGIDLQRRIERAAFAAGGGALRAPATRVTDFLAKRSSTSTPTTSYIPGLTPSNVGEVLDLGGIPIAETLRVALRHFGKTMPGFLSEEAVLIGVETRTSCPVRVLRDPDTLQTRAIAGLYPSGEGAGYAGGIVSAALDGARVATRIAASLRS